MANSASDYASSSVNPMSSAVTTATGAIGAGISALANAREARKQREWNEEMMNKQNQWSLDMWNRTNEYNSPSDQVQRLRDAGLNPLYYGLDGSSANAFESAAPLGYERAQFGAEQNPVTGALDAAVKTAQVSNIQANTAKQSQETLSEIQRREKVSAEIDVAKQELENLKATQKLSESQARQVDKVVEWADRVNAANVAKTEAETALSKSQKIRIDKLLEGELLFQSKSIEDFEYKWKRIDAEIAKMATETGLNRLDIQNYALNHASNGFMGTGLSFQNFIRAIKNGRRQSSPENYSPDSDVETLIREGQ